MFRSKRKNQSSKTQDEDPSDSTPEPSAPSSRGFGIFRRGKRSGNPKAKATPTTHQQQQDRQEEYSDSDYDDSEEPHSLQSGGHYNRDGAGSHRGGPAVGGHPYDDASASSSVTFNSKASRGTQSQQTPGIINPTSHPSAEEQFMAYYSNRKALSPVSSQTEGTIATSSVDATEAYKRGSNDDESEEEPVMAKTPAELEEDRKARARKAVEERKRKAREVVEARKAKARQSALDKAKGSTAVPSSSPVTSSLMDKLEAENLVRKEDEESQQRELEEKKKIDAERAEKWRINELQEQRLREEEEVLRQEEEEMKALEEQLQREEEEARRLAEEEEELTKQDEKKKQQATEEEERLMTDTDDILISNEEYNLEEGSEMPEADLKTKGNQVAPKAEEATASMESAEREEETQKAVNEAIRIKTEVEEEERINVACLKEEENARLFEAEVAARMEDERNKAEEARLAIERFAEEEQRKAEEARLAIENFAVACGAVNDDFTGTEVFEIAESPDDDLNLDDILDGSVSALLDSVLESPMQSPTTDSGKKRMNHTVSKSTEEKRSASLTQKPRRKSNATAVTSKPQRGVGFYKANKSLMTTSPSASSIPKSQFPTEKNTRRPTPTPPVPGKRIPATSKPSPLTLPKKFAASPKRTSASLKYTASFSSNFKEEKSHLRNHQAVDDLVIDTGNEARSFPKSPARSIDSTGSVCSVDRIPRSPWRPVAEGEFFPVCDHHFIPRLHAQRGGCQVCIFKLSDDERARYEKNGRHIRVADTFGGCIDCLVFPSGEGEDPVRLCKQCFFDTHVVRPYEREAFSGNGALVGASGVKKSPIGLKIFSKNMYA